MGEKAPEISSLSFEEALKASFQIFELPLTPSSNLCEETPAFRQGRKSLLFLLSKKV